MKLGSAGIGSFVPAAAAVAGSVALSLLILHSPPPGLLPPGTPTSPVVHGHSSAVVLPAPHVARPHASTPREIPRSAQTAVAAKTSHRTVSPPPARPVPIEQTPSPPSTETVPTVPTPETQPVTTPSTPPPAGAAPKTHSNNGRWSSAKAMPWKGTAAKQRVREHKGKPPWAGEKGQQATSTTPSVPAPTETSKTPPGQSKTPRGQSKTPPGQSKTPPGHSKTPPGQSAPPGQTDPPPGQADAPPGQDTTPPGRDSTPPGQAKKGK
jgi:hypothetical protein